MAFNNSISSEIPSLNKRKKQNISKNIQKWTIKGNFMLQIMQERKH
jgi:hypothetical protein